jgi:hypothetical protein
VTPLSLDLTHLIGCPGLCELDFNLIRLLTLMFFHSAVSRILIAKKKKKKTQGGAKLPDFHQSLPLGRRETMLR